MKKKILIAAILVGSATAVAFASFKSNKKKECTQQKAEKKEKSCCKHSCLYNSI